MMDDPAELERRNAYLDTVRAIGQNIRPLGFICCVVGVVVLVWARFRGPGALSPVGILGIGVIAVGWGIFAYVMWARARYIRTHPYKPEP